MNDLELMKKEAWEILKKQNHHCEFVEIGEDNSYSILDQYDFNKGFDAGVKAERERIKNKLLEWDMPKYTINSLFPDEVNSGN